MSYDDGDEIAWLAISVVGPDWCPLRECPDCSALVHGEHGQREHSYWHEKLTSDIERRGALTPSGRDNNAGCTGYSNCTCRDCVPAPRTASRECLGNGECTC